MTDATFERRQAQGRWAWAMFDWGQHAYWLLVATFIFTPYFTTGVIGDGAKGQTLMGYAGAIAGVLIAIMSPIAGALTDAYGARRWLALLTIPFVGACMLLWMAEPGRPDLAIFVATCLVVANVATEVMTAVANALLPALAKPGQVGRLSAFGWAMGYFGGLVSLILVLLAFTLPAQPLFGLDKALHEPERLTGPISALWFLVFGLPLLVMAPSKPVVRAANAPPPLSDLWAVLKSLPKRPVILRFLIGRMLVGDGIAAIVAFAGIMAAGLFHWPPTELGLYGMLLSGAAGIGAIGAGRIEDRLGSKPTTLVSAVVLTLGMFGMLLIGADSIAGVATTPQAAGDGLFATPSERAYLAASFVLGLAFGPLQSSLRAWMAKLAPPEEAGRLFGLYTLSGKASAFLAPLVIAIVTAATGKQKAAIVVAACFVAVGCAVLASVRGRDVPLTAQRA